MTRLTPSHTIFPYHFRTKNPMPRENIDRAGVRNRLRPRREPYWGAPVERGLYVGFRRLAFGGNWVARYYNDDGRQAYKALGPVSDENNYDVAKSEARRWRKSVDAGVTTGEVDTVAEACADYVRALRNAGREAAAADAERRFARVIDADPLGNIKLARLRERHLDAWRERLMTGKLTPLPKMRGRPRVPKPLSPTAFSRMLTSLKAALNRAVSKRYVSQERAFEWQVVKPPKGTVNRRHLYLDKDQRRALLEAAQGNFRDYVECVALTGCRPGDPAAVLRKDYDAHTGSVTFRTKDHLRTIPLSPAAKALLDRLAKSKLPNAYLFTQNDGAAWQAHIWRDLVKEAAASAALPSETVLYTLRHSWITDAIIGGMDLLTVSKLAGTSLLMIERNYGHLVQDVAREKLAAVAFV
ncbi:tyrosine-type recombinase/integrase [Luteimonas sp. BDR2-5]|uniref:tyrosine-type recombinase/integrase n=1 Tax=Proluteimonas luteida TaxID=2878685 RepID=UPI001E40B5CB|nr:tyrosine-type recombinase/integrase [Luteimonas sp. BDR2-5]MCD9026693.1 tyrosine-type recombinase/integrase [Luteimonas sp. BDR2-5]